MEFDEEERSAHKQLICSIKFPRLKHFEEKPIRVFVRKYNEYFLKVQKPAKQLLGKDYCTTEAIRLISLKVSCRLE